MTTEDFYDLAVRMRKLGVQSFTFEGEEVVFGPTELYRSEPEVIDMRPVVTPKAASNGYSDRDLFGSV